MVSFFISDYLLWWILKSIFQVKPAARAAEFGWETTSVSTTLVHEWLWWNSLIIRNQQASDPHPISLLWSLLNRVSQPIPSHMDAEIIELYKYRCAKRDSMVLLVLEGLFISSIFLRCQTHLCSFGCAILHLPLVQCNEWHKF